MSNESLEFHIESNDYFGTLATIISLWNQLGKMPRKEADEVVNDLLFLHKYYKLSRK